MDTERLAKHVAPCRIHGKEIFFPMSEDFASKVSLGKKIDKDTFAIIEITSEHGKNRYIFSKEYLKRFQIEYPDNLVKLRNRDKVNKKLNNRLVIQQLMKEVKWVCSKCLAES